MTIHVNQVGIDFFAMPDPDGYAGIANNGARFVCRYSDGTGGNEDKRTRLTEIETAARHGVDFLANFEFFESTPEEGPDKGHEHGKADRDFWDERGLAPGAGVIVSWEPGNDRSKFDDVARFLHHYREAVQRPIGLYAGLPALRWMRKQELIDFTWLPMSSAASNLDFGNVTQKEYAARMRAVAEEHGINLVQNRNRWYDGRADENVLVTAPAIPWSHLQCASPGSHEGTQATMVAAHPAHPSPQPHDANGKPFPHAAWPGPDLGFGPHDHFGNINGPAASHGGATPEERKYVRMIQQRLVACGFVPGHSDPNDGWADGIFDIAGDGHLDGPTTAAVRRFQAKCRPGPLTTRPGEVWQDDWETLFALT